MASNRAAAVFLNFVDCTDHMAGGGKKDAPHIASNVIFVIKSMTQKMWLWWECVFFLKSASPCDLPIAHPTQRPVTDWILKPLQSLSVYSNSN